MNNFISRFDLDYYPEILQTDPALTKIPYIILPVPKIEPDNWDLFWELINTHQKKSTNFNDVWLSKYIWVNPTLTETQIKNDFPKISSGVVDDWSIYFPNMFRQIFECMPYIQIDKISVARNIKRVPIHIDATKNFYPWPNTLRIMIYDSNPKATFYLTKWPDKSFTHDKIKSNTPKLSTTWFEEEPSQSDKIYVNLPKDKNVFVYSNGAYMHGADLAEPKYIILVWGTPDPIKWKEKLYNIINK